MVVFFSSFFFCCCSFILLVHSCTYRCDASALAYRSFVRVFLYVTVLEKVSPVLLLIPSLSFFFFVVIVLTLLITDCCLCLRLFSLLLLLLLFSYVLCVYIQSSLYALKYACVLLNRVKAHITTTKRSQVNISYRVVELRAFLSTFRRQCASFFFFLKNSTTTTRSRSDNRSAFSLANDFQI